MAFDSNDLNLDPHYHPTVADVVYLRDRVAGTTSLISLDAAGEPAGPSLGPYVLSADGGTLAFDTMDNGANFSLHVRDLRAGVTTTVDTDAQYFSLSADGRMLAYDPDPGPNTPDQFLLDRTTGITTKLPPGETPHLSGDGSHVIYMGGAYDNSLEEYDIATGTSTLVGVTPDGTPGSYQDFGAFAAVSYDGRYVAFSSNNELTSGSEARCAPYVCVRIYRRDTVTGTTQLVVCL